MADGYARASGGIGVALVVPGPGLLNAAAGLNTAYSASSPVLMISGQVPQALRSARTSACCTRSMTSSSASGRSPSGAGACWKWPRCRRPCTRPSRQLTHRPAAPGRDRDAARHAWRKRARRSCCSTRCSRCAPAAAAADVEPRGATCCSPPQRPVIYAGGGVVLGGAHEALTARGRVSPGRRDHSAPRARARSATTPISRWAPPSGRTAGAQSPAPADLILAVGTRFALACPRPISRSSTSTSIPTRSAGTTGSRSGSSATPGPPWSHRGGRCGHAPPRSSRKARARGTARGDARRWSRSPRHGILKSLREGTPENAIFIAGMTQIGYYSRPCWPVYEPRTYLSSSYSGNLGYEYPVALGAKVACPQRPVVAVIGDGGFMYNVQELATAVQQKINVVAVVFNDNAFGNVARDLDESWGGSYGASAAQPRLHEAGRRLRRPRHARQGAHPGRRPRARGHPARPAGADRGAGGPHAHARSSSRRGRRPPSTSADAHAPEGETGSLRCVWTGPTPPDSAVGHPAGSVGSAGPAGLP